jgi:hypothetical protein
MNIMFIFFLVSSAFAISLKPVLSSYDFQSSPEYQAIFNHLKTFGEFSKKDSKITPDVPRPMGPGERMVEEAKARNRAILAQMDRSDSNPAPRTELEKWKQEEQKQLAQWKKETRDLLAQWNREQAIFLGKIKVYKAATFELPVKKEKIVEKSLPVEALPSVHVVNGTFHVPMRDQMGRPTCVAFAGIRALEIILSQHDKKMDLSEQYLYWAGKPNCQKSPCSERGAWIREAFDQSKMSSVTDIPQEDECAYNSSSLQNNETQLPLASGCFKGVVKVESFDEVRALSDVIEKLKENKPVIVAAKLTENFYVNKGLVTLEDSQNTGKKQDSHSLGHAFLAVGVIELPVKLKSTEGDYCLLVANSWGKGWGAGGYACITQKWMEKYRQPSAFIALSSAKI